MRARKETQEKHFSFEVNQRAKEDEAVISDNITHKVKTFTRMKVTNKCIN